MRVRSLRRVVIFWLILGILLYGIEFITRLGVQNAAYAQYTKVNLIAGHKIKPPIAIFGSSVGEVGINAKMISDSMNSSAYNFSIDGTRFMQYEGLIRELDQYDDSCKLVVMAESFFALTKIDQLNEVDRYIAHINNDNIYGSLHRIQPDLIWKLRHVPFYKFIAIKQSYYKAAVMGLLNLKKGNEINDPYKGYTPRDLTWQADMDAINKKGDIIEVKVDSAAFNTYKNVVQQIRKKGRKVLIIIPPIYKDGLLLLHNLDLERAAFRSLEGNGVHFVDYSNCILSEDKKYFYNNSHLNSVGADYFTQLLLSDIKNILSDSSGYNGELGSK